MQQLSDLTQNTWLKNCSHSEHVVNLVILPSWSLMEPPPSSSDHVVYGCPLSILHLMFKYFNETRLLALIDCSRQWHYLIIVISFFRKSLKSLFFLLPLLGVTNVLHFVWPNPLRGSWQSFAVWSITSHFLYSFQGLFVASVYFLFDDKVCIIQGQQP